MTIATSRYTRIAIALHWAIAALIILNLGLGLVMEGLSREYRRFAVHQHVSVGYMVLALTLARIAWRLSHKPPPLPAHYPAWERTVAHAAHVGFYGFMLAMPILGWLILSANLHAPMTVFGLVTIPPLAPLNALPPGSAKMALHDKFVLLHTIGGWSLIALLALHVGAALKHQVVDGDAEFQRMGVGPRTAPSLTTES